MHITVDNAHSWLVANELLSPDAIVEGEFEVTSAVRRNRNLRVTSNGFGSYLIKQPEQSEEQLQSLRREIGFYAVCSELARTESLRTLLPRMAFADVSAGVLVLDLLEDATPLWGHYEERTASDFPVEAAEGLGRGLAALHRTFQGIDERGDEALGFLAADLPAVLSLHQPTPNLLAAITNPAYRVLSLLQTDQGLRGRLEEIRSLWARETVIHGDVKLDNVLVRAQDDPARVEAGPVCLVDWELVQYGDPAWDVGGALHDFIVLWIMTLPVASTVDEMLEGERYPLSVLRPASRRLWHGYVAGRHWGDVEARPVLERAVAYAGARLVQSAFELALGSSSVPAGTLLMLQVASNMWKDLAAAGDDLFGLRAGS